jgi:hypothetical protein
MFKRVLIVVLIITFAAPLACRVAPTTPAGGGEVFIPFKSEWKYEDSGRDLGTAWRRFDYDDSAWKTGRGVLGYGEDYINTELSFGPDPDNKTPTYYFRKNFYARNLEGIRYLRLSIRFDDSFALYVNGKPLTQAYLEKDAPFSEYVGRNEGKNIARFYRLSPSCLREGENVAAVEVHQRRAADRDLVFDMMLETIPVDVLNIINGPYVQRATEDSVTILWETEAPCEGILIYQDDGEAVEKKAATKDGFVHEAVLHGLRPGQTYDYRTLSKFSLEERITINTKTAPSTFATAPDEPGPFRFVAYGDTRSNPEDHAAVVNAILREKPLPRLVLHTGDLVSRGKDFWVWEAEFFEPMAPLMAKIPLWPCVGNHEQNSAYYFDFFTLPGAADGPPDHQERPAPERWYSFDYAGCHFVALDTDVEVDPESPQYKWLEDDLQRARARWKFAFFHHPAFSSGPHGARGEEKMKAVAEHLVPLFEKYHVSVAFAGHDHNYERSLKDGIYYITAGGGGAPLYSRRLTEEGQEPNPYSQFFQSIHHFVSVDVDESRLLLHAVDVKGNVFDKLEIRK